MVTTQGLMVVAWNGTHAVSIAHSGHTQLNVTLLTASRSQEHIMTAKFVIAVWKQVTCLLFALA